LLLVALLQHFRKSPYFWHIAHIFYYFPFFIVIVPNSLVPLFTLQWKSYYLPWKRRAWFFDLNRIVLVSQSRFGPSFLLFNDGRISTVLAI
jgi:hypothetical protein